MVNRLDFPGLVRIGNCEATGRLAIGVGVIAKVRALSESLTIKTGGGRNPPSSTRPEVSTSGPADFKRGRKRAGDLAHLPCPARLSARGV